LKVFWLGIQTLSLEGENKKIPTFAIAAVQLRKANILRGQAQVAPAACVIAVDGFRHPPNLLTTGLGQF